MFVEQADCNSKWPCTLCSLVCPRRKTMVSFIVANIYIYLVLKSFKLQLAPQGGKKEKKDRDH